MTKPLKAPKKTSHRALFLRKKLCFTPKKAKNPLKTPPAVDYRGIFDQKKYAVKEPDHETGLYYYGSRYLDPKTSRWLSGDPALGDYLPTAPLGDEERKRNGNLPGQGGVFNYVNLHVYHYAGNNPVKYVDPDGRDVEVTANGDGTYTITGGTLNSDKNIYIMQDGERTGEVLGQTFTENSFFNDNNEVVVGTIIDTNDNSGQEFIDNIQSHTPNLISYMKNATRGEKYDFKRIGGKSEQHYYRGMKIKGANGNKVYASARDVGNYVAGYVAGAHGLSWFETRFGLDLYQSYHDGSLRQGKWSVEGATSQKAQRIGFNAGQFVIRNSYFGY